MDAPTEYSEKEVEAVQELTEILQEEHTCPKCSTWWIPCYGCGKKMLKGDNFRPFFPENWDEFEDIYILCQDCPNPEEEEETDNDDDDLITEIEEPSETSNVSADMSQLGEDASHNGQGT